MDKNSKQDLFLALIVREKTTNFTWKIIYHYCIIVNIHDHIVTIINCRNKKTITTWNFELCFKYNNLCIYIFFSIYIYCYRSFKVLLTLNLSACIIIITNAYVGNVIISFCIKTVYYNSIILYLAMDMLYFYF